MKLYHPTFDYENTHLGIVVGLDEAGCGCWAGPVVAACVFLKQPLEDFLLSQIYDSKTLSRPKREKIFDILTHHSQVFYGVGQSSPQEIDQINIRQAAMLAMKRAYEHLSIEAAAALVDGTGKPPLPCVVQTIIKGDQQSYSIAAASIIAKVTRDKIMEQLALEYPAYGWEKNAAYGTADHQRGLAAVGVSPHHRLSYKPIQAVLGKIAIER